MATLSKLNLVKNYLEKLKDQSAKTNGFAAYLTSKYGLDSLDLFIEREKSPSVADMIRSKATQA